ncbi:MAG: UbiD family decarboxylase [Planctomycetaceae bacterium]
MASDHLADWLAQWHDVRELLRVSAEVDAVHEIAAITDRVRGEQGGPALLFEHVRGHSFPIVTNLLGSPSRLASALDVPSFERLSQRIDDWLSLSLPRGAFDTWKLLPRLAELAQWPPTVVKTGLCQQVVKLGRDVNLAELPALTMWPGDAAPTITAGQLHSQSPRTTEAADDSRRQVCVVPLEVRGRDGLLIHGDESSELWSLLAEYRSRGQQMPVAVVLGGDPVLNIASWAPLPARTDALVFAGFLRNRSVELVAARSIPMTVPASAEFVIEGFVDPQAAFESAGPISRETGFFGPSESLPLLRVTAITHRANPVFPAMIPGPAPAESQWLDRACERLLLPIARLWIPELVDWRLPFAGAARHLVFVSIHKTFAQQARKVLHALWSLPKLATAKLLVIVDDEVDVRDENSVWSSVAAHADPSRDFVLWDGPADPLDHATAIRGAGRKLGIDATRKWPGEGDASRMARPLRWTAEIAERLQSRWPEFGL